MRASGDDTLQHPAAAAERWRAVVLLQFNEDK
jgi:hypothetical protein